MFEQPKESLYQRWKNDENFDIFNDEWLEDFSERYHNERYEMVQSYELEHGINILTEGTHGYDETEAMIKRALEELPESHIRLLKSGEFVLYCWDAYGLCTVYPDFGDDA